MTPDPTNDKPRWTVDDDGDLLFGQEGVHYTMCIERQRPGRPSENRAEAIDALVAAVRDAAEVPALRARLAEVEAELADVLDPEEEPYSSTRILEARLEAAEAERDAAREELLDKWELYRACMGFDVYEELTPRINKLYMALNARSRGDENDFDGDPALPWNRLVELTATAVLRWIVAQRWAVNEHQRVVAVEAERDQLAELYRPWATLSATRPANEGGRP